MKTVSVSPSKKVRTHASPQKEEQKDWSFVADNEILIKELDLGRDLLQKAIHKINSSLLKSIIESNSLSADDKKLVQIMISLVDLASGGHEREGWEDSKVRIHENSYDILFNLQNFSENV